MKGTIETPRVAKIVLILLTHLFSDVILTLEKEAANQVVFGKQLAIRKCMNDVREFILSHPYGIFTLEVLDSDKRDLQNPILTIGFKNFINDIPNMVPMKYHIILDETYTTYETFQSSIDGILLRIRI